MARMFWIPRLPTVSHRHAWPDQGREHLHLFAHFRCHIVNARTGEGLPDTRHLGQWASGFCHRGLASLG
ncbi:hypothetical protein [Bilophila wadsworthia]